MSNPNHVKGSDWKKYQKFSKQVERKIKYVDNKFYARAKLWIEKLNSEYLGGGA